MKRRNLVQEQFYPLILLITSPLISVIIAIKEYKSKWAENLLWLFIIFFTTSLAKIEESWDIHRYIEDYLFYTRIEISFSEFWENVTTNSPDFLQPTINYILSKFSKSTQFLLAVYGLIYGYFYSRNLFFIIRSLNGFINRSTILLVFSISFIVSILDFNGFRYWTATHIFIYGLINYYLLDKKTKGFLWILMTPSLHFSFSLNVIIFFIHELFFKKRVLITLIIFGISFGIGSIGVTGIIPSQLMPSSYQTKVNAYTSKGNIESVKQAEKAYSVNRYVKWPKDFLNYFTWATIVILFFELNTKGNNFPRSELLSMALLYGSVANLAASNSISGARLLLIFDLMFYVYVIYAIQEFLKNYYFKLLFDYYTWIFVVSAIINIRRIFDYLGFSAIMGGPIIRLFMPEDIPIIEGFKAFFPSF